MIIISCKLYYIWSVAHVLLNLYEVDCWMNISSSKLWFVVVFVYWRFVDKWEDVWQSGADLLAMERSLVEEEWKTHQSEASNRRHCFSKASKLGWEADGEYYQGWVEAKFGGGRDSPDNSHAMPYLPPPQVLETQDSSEEPKRDGDNIMIESSM